MSVVDRWTYRATFFCSYVVSQQQKPDLQLKSVSCVITGGKKNNKAHTQSSASSTDKVIYVSEGEPEKVKHHSICSV